MKTKLDLKDPFWTRLSRPSVSPASISLKKALAIWLMAISTVAAFAQGKVSLQLGSGSAITLPMSPYDVLPGDWAFAGQQVPTAGPLPSGAILMVALYGGTSSSSLSLQYGEALNPVGGTGQPPGVILAHNVSLTGITSSSGSGAEVMLRTKLPLWLSLAAQTHMLGWTIRSQ